MNEVVQERLASLISFWPFKLFLSAASFLFGPWREAYGFFLVVLLLDAITGVMAAAKRDELSYGVGLKKFAGKLLFYVAIIAFVVQLEKIVATSPVAFGAEYTVSVALIWAALTEGTSFLKHLEFLTGKKINPFNPAEAAKEFEKQLGEKE